MKMKEDRKCIECNSYTTFKTKEGWSCWYKHQGGWLCKSCYMKKINNPKWQKIHSVIYSPKRITFKNKRIRLKENPRKGKCSKCGKNKGDLFTDRFGKIVKIKQTHMHHQQYDENDPLKNTEELCSSCHAKITCKDAYFRRTE